MSSTFAAIEAPSVLANRGIPVLIAKVQIAVIDGNPEIRAKDDEAERVYVRMDNRTVSYVEEKYGSIDKWERALSERPFSVVIDTLSQMWRKSVDEVAVALFEGQVQDYALALTVASYRAQGVPVDDAGKLLKQGLKMTSDDRQRMKDRLDRMLNAYDEPETSESQPEQLETETKQDEVTPMPNPTNMPPPELVSHGAHGSTDGWR